MKKSLDARLSAIRSGGDAFIIAYAADPDMGAGVTGASSSMQAYCEDLTAIVEQAKIDILLTSVSNMDILARQKHLFDHSPVTPAIRANDTTEILAIRNNRTVRGTFDNHVLAAIRKD